MPSYFKAEQLGRGPKRSARIKLGPEGWVRLRRAKLGTCRLYGLGKCEGRSELHHIVSRAQGGDDIVDNLLPLCSLHHRRITERNAVDLERLALSLTDAEYAQVISKLGEGALERLFGVMGR